MKKNILHILGLLVLTFASSSMAGNFHYQIDVMSQLLSDSQGKFTTLQMSWLYDEKMTKMLLQGEDLSPANKARSLDGVGNLIMADLKDLHYFTQLQLNGKAVKITNVQAYDVTLIEDKYLRLLFDIPLTPVINPSAMKLSISLADPNGAAILFYDAAKRITLENPKKNQCKVELTSFKEFEHGKAAQRADINCK